MATAIVLERVNTAQILTTIAKTVQTKIQFVRREVKISFENKVINPIYLDKVFRTSITRIMIWYRKNTN